MTSRLTFGIALSLSLTSVAHADRDKAATAYKQGSAAFAKGAFGEAAALFESAFSEDPRGASIYNAALSWQNARDDARAADDFTRAIASSDLRADLLDNSKAQLAKLETTLGRVALTGPPGAHFAVAHANGTTPAQVHLAPGHYVVHTTFEGAMSNDVPIDISAGALTSTDLTPHAVAPVVAVHVDEPTKRTGVIGKATLPISLVVIGTAAVAAGFWIGLGVAALDASNTFHASNLYDGAAHDKAVTFRDWSNVTFVTALVLGTVGVAALATVHSVKVQAAVGPGSLVLHGTF